MMGVALAQAPWISVLARAFENGGEKLFLVGGAVRNP